MNQFRTDQLALSEVEAEFSKPAKQSNKPKRQGLYAVAVLAIVVLASVIGPHSPRVEDAKVIGLKVEAARMYGSDDEISSWKMPKLTYMGDLEIEAGTPVTRVVQLEGDNGNHDRCMVTLWEEHFSEGVFHQHANIPCSVLK